MNTVREQPKPAPKRASVSRFDRITRLAVTGSTNDDMTRILGGERARGLTLVADYQESGSGRKGRAWIAPAGSALLCTIGLPDPVPTRELWLVPFWTALVVGAALRSHGVDPLLQWPNDVLIGGRKVAGILCISRVTGDYAWVGCGIGINVLRPQGDETLETITPPPAFVSDVANADREAILQSLLHEADTQYDDLHSAQRVVRAWEEGAHVPGARYRILLDGQREPFEAIARRLKQDGSLLVDRDGTEQTISLADARVLRE